MGTIILLNNTLEYIERNLDTALNIDDISKVACSSRYHFQRIFHALTGFTVTQYIKNRRLTLAAEDLVATDKRVIDIALKYGYESPEAFTKAFKRLHGISPSALKKLNGKIKAFPKLSFQISIKGEHEIIYKIVEKEAFKVFGAEFATTRVDDAAYREIPEFINKIFEDGTHDRMNEILGNPKGTLLNGFHYGFEEDGTRKYIMGAEQFEKYIPDEFTILEVQKLTWAVFEGNGAVPNNLIIHDIWRRIYSEWFPSSGFEQVKGPCIEKNFWDDKKHGEYKCEVWIPVKINNF
ncbi:AraC family transcriptional regulator [Clostridium estertheticum]|uniref:AraC family transcriptional regulator n=1 Tax=Clostridium estertheticum TaxID=238834 RepID=UPI001CF4F230|nr:AraC family transcriptional regulator [Clostridium estertheticum]MCB2358237.1 AraC family transcriptional regulator [Clostridium estertheticum]